MSACHGLDRADEVYCLRGERDPTAGGAPSLVELDVWIAHRRTVLQRAGNGGGDDRSVDRPSTLVGVGISAGQWRSGAHVSDDTLVCVLDAGMGAKPRWLSCALWIGGPIPGERRRVARRVDMDARRSVDAPGPGCCGAVSVAEHQS